MDPAVVAGLRRAYAGRRVFITGDTGFKGSWLAIALAELGADLSGYALPCERPTDHFATAGLADIIAHRDGDIRDLDGLRDAIGAARPEVVFHLAAQALVRASYADPKRTFDTNVGGSLNVLEAIRGAESVRAVVYVTSDKCYRNKEWTWGYRENDELGGDDPYSASKAAAELLFASYSASFFRDRIAFGAASVRAGNIIGGGDWSPDRIVPDCMRALFDRLPVVLRNPGAVRPWQHVLEPVFGYLTLGSRLLSDPRAAAGAWNFGPLPQPAVTVGDLAQRIVALWGAGEVRLEPNPNAPLEHGMLQLNCDKARQLLGWEAQWPVDMALRATVEWYQRVHRDGEPAVQVSQQQIKRYMDGQHD